MNTTCEGGVISILHVLYVPPSGLKWGRFFTFDFKMEGIVCFTMQKSLRMTIVMTEPTGWVKWRMAPIYDLYLNVLNLEQQNKSIVSAQI